MEESNKKSKSAEDTVIVPLPVTNTLHILSI